MDTEQYPTESFQGGAGYGASLLHTSCERTARVIAQWLSVNGKACGEIHFSVISLPGFTSPLIMEVRAVDEKHNRVHLFEAKCERNRYELSYLDTRKPDREPPFGEILVHVSENFDS